MQFHSESRLNWTWVTLQPLLPKAWWMLRRWDSQTCLCVWWSHAFQLQPRSQGHCWPSLFWLIRTGQGRPSTVFSLNPAKPCAKLIGTMRVLVQTTWETALFRSLTALSSQQFCSLKLNICGRSSVSLLRTCWCFQVTDQPRCSLISLLEPYQNWIFVLSYFETNISCSTKLCTGVDNNHPL